MIINHLKAVYMDMAQHITVYRMFEQQGELRPCNTVNLMEDSVIESVHFNLKTISHPLRVLRVILNFRLFLVVRFSG